MNKLSIIEKIKLEEKFYFKFLIFFCVLGLIMSCTKESVTTATKSSNTTNSHAIMIKNGDTLLTASDFAWFGQAHNQGLNYIFNNYVNNLTKLPSDTNALKDTNCFYSSYFVNYIYQPTAQLNSPITLSSFPNLNNLDSIINANYSNSQKNIITEVFNIIENSENTESALALLDSIDNVIFNNITKTERPALWIITNVARYSIQYWSGTDGQKWENKINSLQSQNNGIIKSKHNRILLCWGSVAKADVGGMIYAMALTGMTALGAMAVEALTGAVTAVLASGGSAAIPMAAVIGTAASIVIANGVACSVQEIWNQICPW